MVVSGLCLENKGSRFESCHHLCAEVNSPQSSSGKCLNAREAGGNSRVEFQMTFLFSCCPVNSEGRVKENIDRKTKQKQNMEGKEGPFLCKVDFTLKKDSPRCIFPGFFRNLPDNYLLKHPSNFISSLHSIHI